VFVYYHPASDGVDLVLFAFLGLEEMLAVVKPGQFADGCTVKGADGQACLLADGLVEGAVLTQRPDFAAHQRKRGRQPERREVLAFFQSVIEEVPSRQSVLRRRLQQTDRERAKRLAGLDEQ